MIFLERIYWTQSVKFRDLLRKIKIFLQDFLYSNETLSILFLLGLKSFMFFLTITSPIPCGIFAPLMIMGGILGRTYGHTLKILLGIIEFLNNFSSLNIVNF